MWEREQAILGINLQFPKLAPPSVPLDPDHHHTYPLDSHLPLPKRLLVMPAGERAAAKSKIIIAITFHLLKRYSGK